jgi:hypothetical protein
LRIAGRRISSFIAAAVAAAVLAGGVSEVPRAQAAYYRPCGTFTYKGKHNLFRHRLSCSTAEDKARYVLKHKSAPRHWNCSLDNLSDGFGACTKGQRAFQFVPVPA